MIDAQAHFAATMTEDELLANVTQRARDCGWLVYHTHDSRRSSAGFPDLIMIRRGVTIYAELKSAKGELTSEQRGWLEAIALASHKAAEAAHPVLVLATAGLGPGVETPNPWVESECYPPMRTRLVQVYVWRPVELLNMTIDEVLR